MVQYNTITHTPERQENIQCDKRDVHGMWVIGNNHVDDLLTSQV